MANYLKTRLRNEVNAIKLILKFYKIRQNKNKADERFLTLTISHKTIFSKAPGISYYICKAKYISSQVSMDHSRYSS